MAYNAVEAAIALWAGIRAASVALVGFGLDSVIELFAASMVLWRLRVDYAEAPPERVDRAENRVRRFVGGTFLALALYVTVESASRITTDQRAEESPIGLVLAAASLFIMPLLAAGKFRAAARIDSQALRAEAKETLACAYLSLVLFLGLAGNAWIGWWWADSASALLMVPWLVREGWEAVRGERE
jgi:divalent metal cation (Fe/Co/Zn/Cd) transporter